MDLVTFARAHGVLIGSVIEDGRWHRVPTETHPKKRNGAYMSRGAYALIQDWAAHAEPILWKPEGAELAKVDHEAIARQIAAAAARVKKEQEDAARKAGWILHQCTPATHPYLAAKGFPEEIGNVWTTEDGDQMLCLPMRIDGKLVGLQMISGLEAHQDDDGEEVEAFRKKFLYGQRTQDAVYVIDNRGGRADVPKIFCEGYATGLSVRRALMALGSRFILIITFTAGNLLRVAKHHGEGIVIADFDKPSKQHPELGGHGFAVARELELDKTLNFRSWGSDTVGEDFNDYEQRVGLFRASQSLKPLVMRRFR